MKTYSSIELQSFTKRLKTRNYNQAKLVEDILCSYITFAMGKAGTGKTYVSVAVALHLLMERHIDKIVLTRPAVDAGEELGFLPGNLEEKTAPYLMPLYDAIDFFVGGAGKRKELTDKGIIEIIPLAYMRGRSLNNACIIMDEAQNTTKTQMKMFLTRMGKRSKVIIAGDETQNDLPNHIDSGLNDAAERLEGIDGVSITRFETADVVRHKMVQAVIKAYEK